MVQSCGLSPIPELLDHVTAHEGTAAMYNTTWNKDSLLLVLVLMLHLLPCLPLQQLSLHILQLLHGLLHPRKEGAAPLDGASHRRHVPG